MAIYLRASAPNTGACTLVLTLGSTVQSSVPIVKGNNIALTSGDIPIAGYPISLVYSTALSAWVLTDIAVNLTSYAPLNTPAFVGTPTAPTPAINDNSTKIATSAYVQSNLANYAPLFSPALTGTPLAPTATTGTNNTQIATTAFVQNAFIGLGFGGTNWASTGAYGNGVVYTNSKTYPVALSFLTSASYGSGNMTVYVNGQGIGGNEANNGGQQLWVFVIVPVGGTWQVIGTCYGAWILQ
jgi:hypothetical protein